MESLFILKQQVEENESIESEFKNILFSLSKNFTQLELIKLFINYSSMSIYLTIEINNKKELFLLNSKIDVNDKKYSIKKIFVDYLFESEKFNTIYNNIILVIQKTNSLNHNLSKDLLLFKNEKEKFFLNILHNQTQYKSKIYEKNYFIKNKEQCFLFKPFLKIPICANINKEYIQDVLKFFNDYTQFISCKFLIVRLSSEKLSFSYRYCDGSFNISDLQNRYFNKISYLKLNTISENYFNISIAETQNITEQFKILIEISNF